MIFNLLTKYYPDFTYQEIEQASKSESSDLIQNIIMIALCISMITLIIVSFILIKKQTAKNKIEAEEKEKKAKKFGKNLHYPLYNRALI